MVILCTLMMVLPLAVLCTLHAYNWLLYFVFHTMVILCCILSSFRDITPCSCTVHSACIQLTISYINTHLHYYMYMYMYMFFMTDIWWCRPRTTVCWWSNHCCPHHISGTHWPGHSSTISQWELMCSTITACWCPLLCVHRCLMWPSCRVLYWAPSLWADRLR